MTAEVIAVGSELLRFGRHDGNGDWLIERLARVGCEVVGRGAVGDVAEGIAERCREAARRAEVVLLTGGLGPTLDDRTRQALALALGAPLERDRERLERLREAYRARAMVLGPSQQRMADRPRGSAFLENPIGTAPGLVLTLGAATVFALPGVPGEMRAMYESGVAPWLAARGAGGLARRTLRVAGRYESSVDEQLADLYGQGGVEVTILAAREGVELHLLARGSDAAEAERRIDEVARPMAERLGIDLSGRDDDTLAVVVGRLLAARGATLAVAESCTAGLLAATVTRVPGSSAWFRGGFVAYADELKHELAGVAEATLAEHGAVSDAVARELARGARERCHASYGIGITGIAGPGGGSPDKPVGRVHVALAGPTGIEAWELRLGGERQAVRARTVAAALDALRRRLLETT